MYVCSNMRTGVKTSQTTSLLEEKTAWWWLLMRMANGMTCPATTICPTSARREQVRTTRGKERRGEFSATETVDKDDWEKRWGGREQQDVNWKKRKRLQRVRNVRYEVRGGKGSDWRRQRQNEDVQLTALCCQLFSFKSCTAFKIESQNRKVMKSSRDCVFLCKAARKCCTPSLSKHRDWQRTYLQVILNILTVSYFTLHTSLWGARD